MRTSAIISVFGVAIMTFGAIGAKLGQSATAMNNVVDRTEVMSWVLGVCTFGATSKTPLYEQIKGQIIGLIASGELPVQCRLPPIRQLAGDLGLAANTVARAYRELEVDGFVRSTGRRGTGAPWHRGTVVIRTARPSWPSRAGPSPAPDARTPHPAPRSVTGW